MFTKLFATTGRKVALGLAVLVLFTATLAGIPMMMLMTSTAVDQGDDTATGDTATSCGPVATTAGQTITLDDDQIANARTIVTVGLELKIPDRGLVVAVATALQESTLRNINYGDRDSVGLFQQRNAWGSFTARTDPAASARMFFLGGQQGQPGLTDIGDWSALSITAAAQTVQRSAYPFAYAKWETVASNLVRAVVKKDPLACDDDVTTAGLPSGSTGSMLSAALKQTGDPYVWGAVGPDAFDCSGLVVFAWRQAGFQLKIRTAAQMYQNSTPVAAGQEKPGDLLFGDFDSRVSGAGHVMIVIKPGVAVQAPSAGRDVQITHYTADGVQWRLGRLKASAMTRLGNAA